MASTIDACCEHIINFLSSHIDDSSIVYEIRESPQIEINDRDQKDMLNEMNIYLVPMAYEITDLITRIEYYYVARIGIIVAQKYSASESMPFDLWLREKKEFVEKQIFFALNDEAEFDNFQLVSLVNLVTCDADLAREHKLFYSELEATLRVLITD